MQFHPNASRAALLIALASPAVAQTANPTVIFTEIATSTTSDVPGTLDLVGAPVAAKFISILDLAVREDGGDWILKGQTNLPSTHDQVLLRGGAGPAAMFAQDGRPVQGGAVNELYDFFDTPRPGAWDTAGNLVFGARVRGGVAANFEKVIIVDLASVHTIAAQMGDGLTGLMDLTVPTTGDELLGNSINSIYLLDSGLPSYTVTPITNCSSTRYPAIIRGHVGFKQSGVSLIGGPGEVWDSFGLSDSGGTADGLHYFAIGDTEAATSIDAILAVDDVVVIREGSPVVTGSQNCSTILTASMASNGDWFARGAYTSGDDYAVRNGVLLAQTGDNISGGLPGENWGVTFGALAGNTAGHWILYGNTTNPNVNEDNVLVYDGTTVLLREGQPIDVDGNSLFDDDAFLLSIQPDDVWLTPTNRVFALGTMRNAALTLIGDVFFAFDAETPPTSFCSGDGSLTDHTTPCPCGNNGLPGNGCGHSFDPNGANLSATGFASTDDVVLHSQFEPSNSFTLFMQHENLGDSVFHDGVLCASNPLIRLRGRAAVGGEAFFPNSLFAQDSTTTLSQRGMVTIGSGATRYYAAWYRNASTTFCPPATANVTNGMIVVW